MKQYRTKEIYGDLYENEGKPLAVVLWGSRAGLPNNLNENLQKYLEDNYNLLLLAYFGVGSLVETLECVPIEYFINAIRIVQKEYNISDENMVIIGQSKGAEAALLLTEHIKSSITIACVPGCYVFQGLTISEKSQNPVTKESVKNPKSSWTFNGRELSYIKFYFDDEILEAAKNKNFCKCYEKSIEKNYNEDAIISIDDYKGNILLISEENDIYWPSKKMCNILIENNKNKDNLEHITLELEGHYLLRYNESSNVIIEYLQNNYSN